MSTLPYASPSPLAVHGDVFQAGEVLVVRHNTVLPPFCILCNGAAEAGQAVRLTFTWDPSFKMTQESTLHLRQTAVIHAHLCSAHLRSWRTGRLAGLAGIGGSALLLVVSGTVAGVSELSAVPRYTPLGIAGMLTALVLLTLSMFLLALKTRTLSCRKIDAMYVHLENAHPEFLAALPPMPS